MAVIVAAAMAATMALCLGKCYGILRCSMLFYGGCCRLAAVGVAVMVAEAAVTAAAYVAFEAVTLVVASVSLEAKVAVSFSIKNTPAYFRTT